jgi:hypothetical protein
VSDSLDAWIRGAVHGALAGFDSTVLPAAATVYARATGNSPNSWQQDYHRAQQILAQEDEQQHPVAAAIGNLAGAPQAGSFLARTNVSRETPSLAMANVSRETPSLAMANMFRGPPPGKK